MCVYIYIYTHVHKGVQKGMGEGVRPAICLPPAVTCVDTYSGA